MLIKNEKTGTEEMAQNLRTLAAFSEDLCL